MDSDPLRFNCISSVMNTFFFQNISAQLQELMEAVHSTAPIQKISLLQGLTVNVREPN